MSNAVEFDIPYVLALFALTVYTCELFLRLIAKIVFFRFDSPTVTGVCLSHVDYQKFALSEEEWKSLVSS